MNVRQEMVLAFGDELVQTPLSRAGSVTLDPGSADFLANIGLPRNEILGFKFNSVVQLPFLQDVLPTGSASPELASSLCLGHTDEVATAVLPTRDAAVVLVELDDPGRVTPVNGNVASLGVFLAQCVLHWRRTIDNGVPLAESFAQLIDTMKRCDPGAFGNPAWYWPLVCEQLEAGML
jgi:hypothetical protein